MGESFDLADPSERVSLGGGQYADDKDVFGTRGNAVTFSFASIPIDNRNEYPWCLLARCIAGMFFTFHVDHLSFV